MVDLLITVNVVGLLLVVGVSLIVCFAAGLIIGKELK